MFGSYRLILALIVALSHNDLRISGINPGGVAVICFYVLSGYVMTGLIKKHYSKLSQVTRYYADRALRIFPHYLAILLLVLLYYALVLHDTLFLSKELQPLTFLENCLILPVQFIAETTPRLVPVVWFLAIELQFYILLPFLLAYRLRVSAFVISMTVYLLAVFGFIASYTNEYAQITGVLFMFTLGSWLYDFHSEKSKKLSSYKNYVLPIVLVSGIVLELTLAYTGHLNHAFTRETVLGVMLGVLFTNFLSQFSRQPIDEFLGNLSYGVFLNHVFVKLVFFNYAHLTGLLVILYLGLSIIGAYVLYELVESPLLHLRRKLRLVT